MLVRKSKGERSRGNVLQVLIISGDDFAVAPPSSLLAIFGIDRCSAHRSCISGLT